MQDLERITLIAEGDQMEYLKMISNSVADRLRYDESGDYNPDFRGDNPDVKFSSIDESGKKVCQIEIGKLLVTFNSRHFLRGTLAQTTSELIFGLLEAGPYKKLCTIVSYIPKTQKFQKILIGMGFSESININRVIIGTKELGKAKEGF